MHQIAIISKREIKQAKCALSADELEGGRIDSASVVESIVESVTFHIIGILRKTTTNSILADGIFDNRTAGITDGVHDEGTWVLLATEKGNSCQFGGEIFDDNHNDRLVLGIERLW
jgi:hypothetical protein